MRKTLIMFSLFFVILLCSFHFPAFAQDPGIPDTVRFLPWGVYFPSGINSKVVVPLVVVNDESLRSIVIPLHWSSTLTLDDVTYGDQRSDIMDDKWLHWSYGDLLFTGAVSQGKPSIPPGTWILFYLHFWTPVTGTAYVDTFIIDPIMLGFGDNSEHGFAPTFLRSESSILFHSAFPGDADFDGQTTLSDVVFLINYLFKGGPTPTYPPSGDVNTDGKTTISDVIYFINYLFNGGPCLGGACYN